MEVELELLRAWRWRSKSSLNSSGHGAGSRGAAGGRGAPQTRAPKLFRWCRWWAEWRVQHVQTRDQQNLNLKTLPPQQKCKQWQVYPHKINSLGNTNLERQIDQQITEHLLNAETKLVTILHFTNLGYSAFECSRWELESGLNVPSLWRVAPMFLHSEEKLHCSFTLESSFTVPSP